MEKDAGGVFYKSLKALVYYKGHWTYMSGIPGHRLRLKRTLLKGINTFYGSICFN